MPAPKKGGHSSEPEGISENEARMTKMKLMTQATDDTSTRNVDFIAAALPRNLIDPIEDGVEPLGVGGEKHKVDHTPFPRTTTSG
jgi:hypothetical protein